MSTVSPNFRLSAITALRILNSNERLRERIGFEEWKYRIIFWRNVVYRSEMQK